MWKPEIHCRIYKGSPVNPILSRINQFPRVISISLRSVLILSSHLRLGLPKGLFPLDLPVTILKALLPFFHSDCMACQTSRFHHPDYMRCTAYQFKCKFVSIFHLHFSSVCDHSGHTEEQIA
jgi:hypothetical protein